MSGYPLTTLARLARLAVDPDGERALARELDTIAAQMARVLAAGPRPAPPPAEPVPTHTVTRPDLPTSGDGRHHLQSAPDRFGDWYRLAGNADAEGR